MVQNPGTKLILPACGVLILFYCLLVLGFVGTSPDVGLRFLLVDEGPGPGVVITQVTPALKNAGGERPRAGDILLGLGPSRVQGQRLQPINSFVHFTRALVGLRSDVPHGGKLEAGADPSEHGQMIPPLAEVSAPQWYDRQRWVEIEFRRPQESQTIRTWLKIQALPYHEVLLSFVWFLLEMGIFSVGALAYWKRPFDRPARLFFAMCIVALGAFVGGFHWWVIAGNFWLNLPFCICALLVPVVTLHFFLSFPNPKPPLTQHPVASLALLYSAPIIAMGVLISLLAASDWQYLHGTSDALQRQTLHVLRTVIYGYLGVAAVYFGATLVALVYSFFHTRNPIEHNQVKWILWAGLVATLPVSYTLYLAHFHRVDFSVGAGRVPMFLASLLFMLAYAVGIVRFKLMLVEQIFSREILYFLGSVAVTGVCSLLIALGCLVGVFQDLRSPRQAIVVAATLMFATVLLVWLRDSFQRMLDRRFFREKYQLDKALQQMHVAGGHLLDPAALGERILGPCREVLLVDRGACYLRDAEAGMYRLVAADVPGRLPMQIAADAEMEQILTADGPLQRLIPATREARLAPPYAMLRHLKGELVHVLAVDGQTAGFVVLGPKRTGTPYTAEDLTFLTALGQATSVALHSARVHQVVERLNKELQVKVEKISEQQRQIALLQGEINNNQRLPAPAADEADGFRRESIKGNGPAIRAVLETVRKVSSSHSSVLIRGESGTGKELLAQTLHDNSPRRNGPMIKVHCGALAPGVLESELFGHVKGAFTNAHKDRVGRFELAHGGTLFLDEIGDITPETQIKLLRVLQERTFEPVGGTKTVSVDVRLIAATHQNLEKLISEGKFREDLYYRLNVISITLPPLRERADDIFELSLHLLGRAAQRVGKRVSHLDPEAVEALKRCAWPGNIRQLENVLERALVLAEHDRITVADLPAEVLETPAAPPQFLETKPAWEAAPPQPAPPSPDAESALWEERHGLVTALREAGGNKAQAARRLGLHRSTFFSKLKKHGLC